MKLGKYILVLVRCGESIWVSLYADVEGSTKIFLVHVLPYDYSLKILSFVYVVYKLLSNNEKEIQWLIMKHSKLCKPSSVVNYRFKCTDIEIDSIRLII